MTELQREAASVLVDLARRHAEAWDRGDEHAAHRWADLAFRLRGPDVYLDTKDRA